MSIQENIGYYFTYESDIGNGDAWIHSDGSITHTEFDNIKYPTFLEFYINLLPKNYNYSGTLKFHLNTIIFYSKPNGGYRIPYGTIQKRIIQGKCYTENQIIYKIVDEYFKELSKKNEPLPMTSIDYIMIDESNIDNMIDSLADYVKIQNNNLRPCQKIELASKLISISNLLLNNK